MSIDTGDVVLHRPTGEKWLVACVQGDRLSWCGWPEGTANVADCDLIEKATSEKRRKLLDELAASSSDGHRQRYARNVLILESNRADSNG